MHRTTPNKQILIDVNCHQFFGTYDTVVGKIYETSYNSYIDEANSIKVNGDVLGYSTRSENVKEENLCLFYYPGSTQAQFYYSGRIYYICIYDNYVPCYNLIPCYRKSDNVYGLYDLVNRNFYTNAGTGAFTGGDPVNTGWTISK